jgi:hypothetical protein
MQDLPLIRAVAEVRVALMEAMPVLQEGPGGPRTRGEVQKALEALDRVRPAWEAHFGVEGLAFPLDRLVYLPPRLDRTLVSFLYTSDSLFLPLCMTSNLSIYCIPAGWTKPAVKSAWVSSSLTWTGRSAYTGRLQPEGLSAPPSESWDRTAGFADLLSRPMTPV